LNAGRFLPQEGATFSSWGYKILVNTCYTLYQKRKKTFEGRSELPDEALYNLSGKENERKEIELRDTIATLLAHLPKHMHKVLHLHFIMGYRQQEIAEMTGEKVGAVKTRIFRAKEELRRIYAVQNKE
jgi:RNA polymerase sigma-70 factor (ECF subfamily)